jgi:putative FmdB family regulatory protein
VPIYDYICSNCSTRTEFIHGINAPSPKFCPACGAEDTLRKAFVPPAVHFKGSGWAKKERRATSTTASTSPSPDGSAKDGGKASETASGDGAASAGKDADGAKKTSTTTDSGSSASSD